MKQAITEFLDWIKGSWNDLSPVGKTVHVAIFIICPVVGFLIGRSL